MPSIPARFSLDDNSVMFFQQYKKMSMYNKAACCVDASFMINDAKKIWIDVGTNELVIDNVPTGDLFKTSYNMDDGAYFMLDQNAIIIGTQDERSGVCYITKYSLTNLTKCPNVVIKWESANNLSISTACGNTSCSAPESVCKVTTEA
jgi:hypothetical protein